MRLENFKKAKNWWCTNSLKPTARRVTTYPSAATGLAG